MADLDLQIRERGGHPDPERGGGGHSQNFFRLFGSQFGLKIGGASPGSATAKYVLGLCLSTF